MDGRTVHQIGIPLHWGFAGETVGGMANDLTAVVADPNVSMHEAKAFVCQVRAGRVDAHRDLPLAADPRPVEQSGIGIPPAEQPEGKDL
jgi:formate dehydrogenase major subunit